MSTEINQDAIKSSSEIRTIASAIEDAVAYMEDVIDGDVFGNGIPDEEYYALEKQLAIVRCLAKGISPAINAIDVALLKEGEKTKGDDPR